MKGQVLPGLCSITLRDHSIADILAIAEGSGLAGIEWGADVHVKPGDTATATATARRCHDAGIACSSYGTYVMASQTPTDEVAVACDTAVALGATNMRIWAPYGITADSSRNEQDDVARAVAEAADQAAALDLTVSLEFHPRTLTETASSALKLLSEAERPNLFTYWQRDPAIDDDAALAELSAVLSDLSHVHVFQWGSGFDDRQALSDGDATWRNLLDAIPLTNRWEGDRYAFLEFVLNDDPAALRTDISTLVRWLSPQDQDAS